MAVSKWSLSTITGVSLVWIAAMAAGHQAYIWKKWVTNNLGSTQEKFLALTNQIIQCGEQIPVLWHADAQWNESIEICDARHRRLISEIQSVLEEKERILATNNPPDWMECNWKVPSDHRFEKPEAHCDHIAVRF